MQNERNFGIYKELGLISYKYTYYNLYDINCKLKFKNVTFSLSFYNTYFGFWIIENYICNSSYSVFEESDSLLFNIVTCKLSQNCLLSHNSLPFPSLVKD
jgi:hypothetical protein